MKKRLIVSLLSVILCLAMVFAFAACDTEATITGIEAEGKATLKGDGTYDYSALTLNVVYSDGTKKALTEVVENPEVSYADGKFSITIGETKFEFEATLDVIQIASVAATGVAILKNDGTYDFSTLTLKAVYADQYEKSLTVADLTITYDAETEKFKVTLDGKDYDFTAEIVNTPLVSVEVAGKVVKKLDETLDYSALTYEGTFEDGSTKAVDFEADALAYDEETGVLTITVADKTYTDEVELDVKEFDHFVFTGYVDLHADGTYTFANLKVTKAVCKDETEYKLTADDFEVTRENNQFSISAYEGKISEVIEPTVKEARSADAQDSLVIGYANFSNKFSPFFYTTAYDGDVAGLTQVGLLATDRGGAVVQHGLGDGETIKYNGTEYTYKGMSNLEITQNDDGTVYYDITLREGVQFSDGEDLTLDDVIFSIYVISDPSYDGSSTFYSLPIQGMNEYRTDLNTEIYTKYKTIADAVLADYMGEGYNADSEAYTKAEYDVVVEAIETKGWEELANDIIGYCIANYSKYLSAVNNNEVALGMYVWGFGDFDDDEAFKPTFGGEFLETDLSWTLAGNDVPTVADYAAVLKLAYKADLKAAAGTEKANGDYDTYVSTVVSNWMAETGKAEMNGETIDSISGIQVTGANTLRVVTTEFSATTIYQLGITIAPMHYYGDETKFDIANNKFGFDKGDLSIVKSKTTQPMGAGPYKFVSYEQGIVTFEANDLYWEGAPKIANVMFKEYNADADKTPALIAGDIDIAEPSINDAVLKTIKEANSNGELSGNVIETALIDNNGYGYIGIDSKNVNVGGEQASAASKNLRKAIATLFAAYREAAVNSYYGDRAFVINYPISNCSWAAPLPNDEGYEIAFSTDINGDPIYDADMLDDEKMDKALEVAIEFLKAAGYTWDDTAKKFTAAPAGAKMSYEAWIPGDGIGDHPAMAILTGTRDALASVGIELKIKDLANSADLWDALDAGTVDIWAAAWGGSNDPDMYQVYHSSDTTGSNHYHIADDNLDQLILDARKSADTSYRKATYKECLDIILDWAVEIPTYQRKNCTIFSSERVDLDTLTPDMTPFWSYLAEIHKLERTSK